MEKTLEKALIDLAYDSREPSYNFELALQYEQAGQTSAAVSFFLRTAEFSQDLVLVYTSLLKVALCVEKQGNRLYHVKGVLHRALSVLPERPEAYFLLAKVYEINHEYHEGYSMCCIGEKLLEEHHPPLPADVGYPGRYGFVIQRALCAWHIGLFYEAIALLREVDKRSDIHGYWRGVIRFSLTNVGLVARRPIPYRDEIYQKLRYKFPGAKNIPQNYSQCYQDMFVLTMLDGLEHGRFLEIGCGHPTHNNNTYLLESLFQWTGISIDIAESAINDFNKSRRSKAILADATTIDYTDIIGTDNYDYLQIDCEPARSSLLALQQVPLDKIKFAVITFEHDVYAEPNTLIRDQSRAYLQSYGYELVVNNISVDYWSPYEDWWIHPDLVDRHIVRIMRSISDETKKADLYMQGMY